MIDEIEESADPPAIVLKYLDDDLLNASAARRLTTTSDIKYVSKKVLEALKVLHEDGYGAYRYTLDGVCPGVYLLIL